MIEIWVGVRSTLFCRTAQNLNLYVHNFDSLWNQSSHCQAVGSKYSLTKWISFLHVSSLSCSFVSSRKKPQQADVDGNLLGMTTGEVPAPAPAPKVPSLLYRRASHQRVLGVDGADGTMTMIGKAGEVVDTTRRGKIVVGAGVRRVAEYVRYTCEHLH